MYAYNFIVAAFFGIILITSKSVNGKYLQFGNALAVGKQGVRTAEIEEFPSVVAILHLIHNQDAPMYRHDGAGSILSSSYVITSAGCVSGAPTDAYIVRAGSTQLEGKGSVHRVHKIIRHPEYIVGSPGHDLALLKLKNPIALDDWTKKAIPLFSPTDRINPQVPALTAGWGERKTIEQKYVSFTEADRLQSVELRFVDQQECKDIYKNPVCKNETLVRQSCSNYAVQKGEICAAPPGNEAVTSTHGDPGGPLLVNGKLAGVLSRWGGNFYYVSGDFKKWPNVITLISTYRDWILLHMNLE